MNSKALAADNKVGASGARVSRVETLPLGRDVNATMSTAREALIVWPPPCIRMPYPFIEIHDACALRCERGLRARPVTSCAVLARLSCVFLSSARAL